MALLALASMASAAGTPPTTRRDVPQADTSPMLIRDHAIRAELKLSDEQAKAIDSVFKDVNRTLLAMRDEPRQTAEENTARAMKRLDEIVKKTLTGQQYNRFDEITLQLQGAAALLRPDVADQLALTEAQQKRIRDISRLAAAKPKDYKPATQSQPSADAPNIRQRERDRRMFAVLTADQKTMWKSLFGRPFDFSRVRPIGVEAPEFEEVTTWINCEPFTMASLRGQVVVLHFYTFGCGNCIANFPWYKGWQDAFAGKGVTIVGIHTPETEGERDVAAVRRKAQKAGFTFPILVDNNKTNWSAWSNYVWPAVYLVDKEGRVRSWWYGELNWKGAPGEQRMREQINQLLKERTPYVAKAVATRPAATTRPIKTASSAPAPTPRETASSTAR